MVVNTANTHRYSPGSNPRRSLTNYIFSQRNWRVETMGSRITSLRNGYVSLVLPGRREIEGAGKVELVCVGGLWRMGGECLLMPVWRSVRVGFIGKGGVGCLGTEGSYLTARKPPSDGRRMDWDRGQLYQ